VKAAKRLQDAAAVHAAASPMGHAMLQVLGSLTPAQWQKLRDDEMLVFSTKPGDGELPMPAGVEAQLRATKPEFPFPKELFKGLKRGAGGGNMVEALTQAEQTMQQQWAEARDLRVTLQLNLNMAASPVGILRVSPEPDTKGTIGPLFGVSGLMITGA